MEHFLRDTVGFDESITREYMEKFSEHAIDIEVIQMVDNVDTLNRVGVRIGHAVRIMNAVKPSAPPPPPVPMCTTHNDQPLIGLCKEDGELLCQSCKLVSPHDQHICIPPTEAVAYFRDHLEKWHPTGDLDSQIKIQQVEIQQLEKALNTAREKLKQLQLTHENVHAAQHGIREALETHKISEHTTHQQSVVAMTSLHTMWKALGGGIVPASVWMETGDGAGGLRQWENNPNIWFAVAKETALHFPTIKKYQPPTGYRWMSTGEFAAELHRCNTRQHHPYYDKAGWHGSSWKGKEREFFVFCDSDATRKYQHSGNKGGLHLLPDKPVVNLFAGLVCAKK